MLPLMYRADLGSGLARRHPNELQRDVELENRGNGGSDLTERSFQIEERSPTAAEIEKAEATDKKGKKGKDKKDKKDKKKKDKKNTAAAVATTAAATTAAAATAAGATDAVGVLGP
jgi:hypothetical protein